MDQHKLFCVLSAFFLFRTWSEGNYFEVVFRNRKWIYLVFNFDCLISTSYSSLDLMWWGWGGQFFKISHQNMSNWICKHLNSYQVNNLHAHVQSRSALSNKFVSVKCTFFFVCWNLDLDYMTILMQSQISNIYLQILKCCWNFNYHKPIQFTASSIVASEGWSEVRFGTCWETYWEMGEYIENWGTHWEQ